MHVEIDPKMRKQTLRQMPHSLVEQLLSPLRNAALSLRHEQHQRSSLQNVCFKNEDENENEDEV